MKPEIEIGTDKLVKKIMYRLHCERNPRKRFPFWSKVAEAFCIGSTSAREICEWAGYDPDTGKVLEAKR